MKRAVVTAVNANKKAIRKTYPQVIAIFFSENLRNPQQSSTLICICFISPRAPSSMRQGVCAHQSGLTSITTSLFAYSSISTALMRASELPLDRSSIIDVREFSFTESARSADLEAGSLRRFCDFLLKGVAREIVVH